MRPTHTSSKPRRQTDWFWLSINFLCGLTLGCGGDKYQQRLAQTSEYYAYQERINTELSPAWSGRGISLRVPNQFVLVPPPAGPTTEEGETYEPPEEDYRQPLYLGIELPGLVAAWKASVPTSAEGESEQARTAYLYLFSNYDWHLQPEDQSGQSVDPANFLFELEQQVAAAIGVFLPEGDGGNGTEKNVRYVETIPSAPPDTKFRAKQDFTAVTFSPEIPVSDVPLEMQMYEWTGGPMQVALLMVYPASVSPQEKLQERLKMSLQTFAASNQVPRSSSSSGGGRSGPSPSNRF